MEIDPEAFNAFEARGWEQRAEGYHEFFEPITGAVIEPLLDSADVAAGLRVLDVASGPGYVAAAAAERETLVTGVDLSAGMVKLAQRLQPELDFVRGDAEALPFEDESFDAVVANFAILHVGRPERAVAEFARVLAPGGRLALSVWDEPERCRLFGHFIEAVAEAGVEPPADAPAGPDFFRFSEPAELLRLLTGAGLGDGEVETVSFSHTLERSDELFDGLLDGTVRMGSLIAGQGEDDQRAIRRALERRLEGARGPSGLTLPVSVRIGSATKTGSER